VQRGLNTTCWPARSYVITDQQLAAEVNPLVSLQLWHLPRHRRRTRQSAPASISVVQRSEAPEASVSLPSRSGVNPWQATSLEDPNLMPWIFPCLMGDWDIARFSNLQLTISKYLQAKHLQRLAGPSILWDVGSIPYLSNHALLPPSVGPMIIGKPLKPRTHKRLSEKLTAWVEPRW
jgi:hypothetical protein